MRKILVVLLFALLPTLAQAQALTCAQQATALANQYSYITIEPANPISCFYGTFFQSCIFNVWAVDTSGGQAVPVCATGGALYGIYTPEYYWCEFLSCLKDHLGL